MSRGARIALFALLAILVLSGVGAALAYWSQRDEELRFEEAEVVVGSGSFDGRRWDYGYNVGDLFDGVTEPLSDGVCYQLRIRGAPSGCGIYNQSVETIVMWTGSGGDEGGLVTGQGLVSDEVARVRCGTETEDLGEAHLFDVPLPLLRPVLCLGTADRVAGRQWYALAYDLRGRLLGRSDALPER